MYKNLLVPLDGSPFAEHALPLALAIASHTRATIHIALVHTPVATPYDAGMLAFDASLDMTLRDREQAYLNDISKRLAEKIGHPVKNQLLDGTIADTLTSQSEAVHADLVVMTTHGRGALSRFWLGSVADQLIRHLSGRLLLIRPTDEPTDLAKEVAIRKILIPLDGTEFSEQMIRPAIAFGQLMGAEYHLVRIISSLMPHFQTRYADVQTADYGVRYEHQLDTIQENLRQEAIAYLDRLAKPLRAQTLKVHTTVESHEQPSLAILELAKSLSADMIALKTHGRHGLSRMFLGSVADKVLRGASVPVLL